MLKGFFDDVHDSSDVDSDEEPYFFYHLCVGKIPYEKVVAHIQKNGIDELKM